MLRPLVVVATALFAACQSQPAGDKAVGTHPELADHDRKVQDGDKERTRMDAVMVRLDQAIDSYVNAVSTQGEASVNVTAERLEKLIHETVVDYGPTALSPNDNVNNPRKPGTNYGLIQAVAADNSQPERQKVALAALGFSRMPEAMPTILQGAQLSDPYVVEGAVVGLAVLHDPRTPPGVLAAVVERKDWPESCRVNAAWALYRIHAASERDGAIIPIWQRFVAAADSLPTGVLVQAVRGLGWSRSDKYAELVAPFLKHPVPRLRMAAAVAIGRMNAQRYWPELLAMLNPTETSQNVRLHASKALAELAGGTDHGYDTAAWRKTFDRGAPAPEAGR